MTKSLTSQMYAAPACVGIPLHKAENSDLQVA